MEVETRQAALCIIQREKAFLVAEIRDPQTGTILHRPPGGGLEEGETPEQAVRRELLEELGMVLTNIQPLGAIDHIWFWKGRDVRERAWLFLANSSDDERLSGEKHRTCLKRMASASKRSGAPYVKPPRHSRLFVPLCCLNFCEICESGGAGNTFCGLLRRSVEIVFP